MSDSPWTADEFLAVGRYSTRRELVQSVEALNELVGGQVVLATLSGRKLLPSLSVITGRSGPSMVADLETFLQRYESQRDVVAETTADWAKGAMASFLRRRRTQSIAIEAFGRRRPRVGELTVVIAADSVVLSAEHRSIMVGIASRVFGSRAAAIYRVTSINAAIEADLDNDHGRGVSPLPTTAGGMKDEPGISELAAASKINPSSIGFETLAHGSHRARIAKLLERTRKELDGHALLVYREEAHRRLELDYAIGKDGVTDGRDLAVEGGVDPKLRVNLDVTMPRSPDLGGSHFPSVAELVNCCFVMKRRLVGIVGWKHWCFAVPFGAELGERSPQGVMCLVWATSSEQSLDLYGVSYARMVASHLGQAASERQFLTAVRSMAGLLSGIGRSNAVGGTGMGAGCAVHLRSRTDVQLIYDYVVESLRGLVQLSDSGSVTCRLLAGGSGEIFSRALFRVHCEGDETADLSPESISLDDSTTSVNAWVATQGSPVYLRRLVEHEGFYDLAPDERELYGGLSKVAVVRPDVQSELCVPIFAEGRLVGTINLESKMPDAYDRLADVVFERAQVIGVALLEARRQIGVRMMSEAGGFLDRQHELDNDLRDVKELIDQYWLPDVQERRIALNRLEETRTKVGNSTVGRVVDMGAASVHDVLSSASRSVNWIDSSLDPSVFLTEPSRAALLDVSLGPHESSALEFALKQAFHNIRRHGGSGSEYNLFRWPWPVKYGLSILHIGGGQSLQFAISSVALNAELGGVVPEKVYREPIENEREERIALGAYLAGEILRRCGGAALLTVERLSRAYSVVTSEFSVPLDPSAIAAAVGNSKNVY